MEKSHKKLSLLDRLNNGMTAMDLPPGSLVEYKNHKKNDSIFYSRASKPSNLQISPTKNFTFYEEVAVESGTYLLYLGIETLGSRVISGQGRDIQVWGNRVYAHQFLYCEQILYLEISKPDRYYTIFRKYFKRTDDKNNFCR